MNANDWKCSVCGGTLYKTKSGYLTCGFWDMKLLPAPRVEDLPVAKRVNSRRFRIAGEEGYWEYVPHAHKEALDRCPAPGVVVAQIVSKAGVRVRAFRRVKARRK